MLRLLFDDLHQRSAVFIAIFLGLPGNTHAFDERLRHFQFLLGHCGIRTVLQDIGAQDFAGKMH